MDLPENKRAINITITINTTNEHEQFCQIKFGYLCISSEMDKGHNVMRILLYIYFFCNTQYI